MRTSNIKMPTPGHDRLFKLAVAGLQYRAAAERGGGGTSLSYVSVVVKICVRNHYHSKMGTRRNASLTASRLKIYGKQLAIKIINLSWTLVYVIRWIGFNLLVLQDATHSFPGSFHSELRMAPCISPRASECISKHFCSCSEHISLAENFAFVRMCTSNLLRNFLGMRLAQNFCAGSVCKE